MTDDVELFVVCRCTIFVVVVVPSVIFIRLIAIYTFSRLQANSFCCPFSYSSGQIFFCSGSAMQHFHVMPNVLSVMLERSFYQSEKSVNSDSIWDP